MRSISQNLWLYMELKLAIVMKFLGITMPVLIPHRKEQYTDYLYKPLYIAFKQWCIEQNQEQKRYRNMKNVRFVLCILYNRDLPLGRIRDHDNFEESMSLMWISNFFLCQTAACM